MVKVYSVHYIKPEFIFLQYNQLKKYCSDVYELIIVNNGKDNQSISSIDSKCNDLGITCLRFDNSGTRNLNPSLSHGAALSWLIHSVIPKDDKNTLTVIIDSDVFAFKRFSFIDIMNGKRVAGIYQQRFNRSIEYLTPIFTAFYNDIDISKVSSYYPGRGADTGVYTDVLLKLYDVEFVKHTADIDIETEYIFRNNNVKYKYLKEFRCQFIHDCFIHYYRGSNWAGEGEAFHKTKLDFLLAFLDNPDEYNIVLDDKVCYSTSRTDKHFDGTEHNYRNYRFFSL